MKKVLSVLLAAAMVMGMSVSAFAANTSNSQNFVSWDNSTTGTCYGTAADVSLLSFVKEMYVDSTYGTPSAIKSTDKDVELHVGDVLYFYVADPGQQDGLFHGEADEHWNINIKGNEYVKNAEFGNNKSMNNALYVKVTLVSELDDLDPDNVEFQMYIADNGGTKHGLQRVQQSAGVKLNYSFDNYREEYVSFDFINDVDYTAKWIVEEGKKGTAVFDFVDAAYFTVKMIPDEEVIFNFDQAYDKDIDKAYNEYDADLEFYNFKGESDAFSKVGELFIPADEDTYIYEIVDGELVEIDAEWVKSYKVGNTSKAKSGWVIETKELGYYVVADEELVVEEAEDNTNSSTSTDKTNPETGANDFVGAAVALAVVSVAAAGALAFKK